MQDVEHYGCPMKRGDMVLLPLSAATRDPDAFVDAGQVILDRQDNNHVAFGMRTASLPRISTWPGGS